MIDSIQVRQLAYGSGEYEESLRLRNEVLRRPLGMEIANDDLSGDLSALHVGAFAGERLVGILLLRPKSAGVLQMKQVAVDESLRGRSVGRKMVEYAETLAAAQGCEEIVLHAREIAVPFYERLGYAREGERFEEIGIPHYVMSKKLGRRTDSANAN
ncbi:GNAT family N-acetyltransferase [Saccharibacillus sp. O23]|uniref:GNAT family N-acetyltransferase n=1 Tax=Saccharibacillus sp. O23 TaxID=2009338 RepID=UPI000B4DFAD8|nr:GNAT family N-acetyltransferase [Saccharibacillus sp. O23]OWR27797.1 GNAT family N-acetyltransferase [Saccharibacillus sp. O23]